MALTFDQQDAKTISVPRHCLYLLRTHPECTIVSSDVLETVVVTAERSVNISRLVAKELVVKNRKLKGQSSLYHGFYYSDKAVRTGQNIRYVGCIELRHR